jgi:hypothetical protein
MTDFDNRLNVGWWALRIGLGVGPIITGIDKYFNKLADWGMPAFAAVETYKDVRVVDVNCSKKVTADPDSHST